MTHHRSLEAEFLRAARLRSQALRALDSKTANGFYDCLHALVQEMRKTNDRGEAALKKIASDPDPAVRIVAATALLAVDEGHALSLLNDVAGNEPGIERLNAEMVIREWKKGALGKYWK